jgi:fibronectin-binding autotransporter adhesin
MKLFLRSIAVCSIASFTSLAFADDLFWSNSGNSDFTNGQNWVDFQTNSTGTSPGPGQVLLIIPGVTITPSPSQGFPVATVGGASPLPINSTSDQQSISLFVSGFTNLNTGGTAVGANPILNLSFVNGGAATTLTLTDNSTNAFEVTGGATVNFVGNMTVASSNIVVGESNSLIDGAIANGNGTLNLGAGTVNLDSAALTNFVVGQGATGAVTQTTGSTVIMGQSFQLSGGTATSTYMVTNGAILDIGTPTTPAASAYDVRIGSGANSTGTLTIASGSTLNATNSGTTFEVGAGSDSVGSIIQSGGSTVNIGGTSMVLGNSPGSTGNYDLQSGTLTITNTSTTVGSVTGATGAFTQEGGSLSASTNTIFTLGEGGTGTYTMAAGTADFQDGLAIGDGGGNGTFTQNGGVLTVENSAVTLGTNGAIGTYNLAGGMATFSDGLSVGATSSVVQSGGTLAITGGTLDLSAIGSSYTLGGSGILQIGNAQLVGTSGEGTLNFAGGTLQITNAGTFTDHLDGTLTGNSTIDGSTTPGVTSVTLAGNLSGTGGIIFNGATATNFQFGGTNTYTGLTEIASGMLNVSPADIMHSSQLIIGVPGSTGVLNLALGASSFSYANPISGNGTLNVNFNAANETLTLTNASNPVSTVGIVLSANTGPNASLTPGTLQVYGGSFGTISDNGTGSNVVIGDNTGTKTGAVTFGNATYTGTTLINPGFTLNAGTLTSDVTNNGSFFALGADNLTNNGTLGLTPTSAIGTAFMVNGTLSSTGTGAAINIRFNGTGATPLVDSVESTGTATIGSTSTIFIKGSGAITTPIAIVTGNGGLTLAGGALPNVSVSGSLLLAGTLSHVGNSIDLTTAQGFVSPYATTSNQSAVGGTIDQGIANPASLNGNQLTAFSNVLGALNQLTTASQISNALEELTPESLQYSRNIAFENSTFLAQRLNSFCGDLRAGYGGLDTNAISVANPGFDTGLGRSLGSMLAYDPPAFHQPAPNGVNYYPEGDGSISDSNAPSSPSSSTSSSSRSSEGNPGWNSSSQVISDNPNPYLTSAHPNGPNAPNFSEFISGDAVLADLNQDPGVSNAPSSKASYTAEDATAGIAFRMNSNLAAGVLFNYNHTSADTDYNGSKTDIDSYSPGIFATYFDRGFYANGLFSFGYNTYSNTRNISFLNETATSSPTGQQYVGDLDFGYDFHPDRNWVWGPTLGLTYTHLDIDSFTETGAPDADLNVQSQSADSLRSRLGGHVVFQTALGDVLLQPNLSAMWQHEYLDNSSGITSSSNFSPSSFTINTASPSRDSALISLGVTATLSNSIALYLNYIADVGASDYFAQSVVGGFKARF